MRLPHFRAMKVVFCGLPIFLFIMQPLADSEKIQLKGYFDTVLGHNRYGSGTLGFDMYHLTTITYYRVTDRIRIVGDVTFEHGPIHEKANVGDIKVRGFSEICLADELVINIGKFLTPFGEQNLYHDATPAYTSVNSPRSLYWKRSIGMNIASKPDSLVYKNDDQDRLFAKEGAGIWLHGNVDVVDYLLEYNVYVTNGRGAGNPFKVDDNDDKGVGAKIVLESPFGLKLGGSYYQDRNGRWEGMPMQRTSAGQISYVIGNLTVAGEYMYSLLERAFEKDIYDPASGFYGQMEYAFLEKITPYIRYEEFTFAAVKNQDETVLTGGVNYMLHPSVYLKAEYGIYNGISFGKLDRADDVFQMQIAIAF